MKKIAFLTLGCKVNQYESACIKDSFISEGFEIVDFSESANVYLINTCNVTNRTDYKSRNAIRLALKQKEKSPETIIIVTGCYSQNFPESVDQLGQIDYIIDNNNKNSILSIIKGEIDNKFKKSNCFELFDNMFSKSMHHRTRAFLKIQDGCDFYCSYCAVPYARGKPRSRNIEDILEQIALFIKNGHKEIVLTGINLGLFGTDNNSNLIDLIHQLEKINELKKIRISSLEPQFFSDDFIDLFKKSDKICPHFHLPLQSGSNKTLAKMNRKYNTDFFRSLTKKIYSAYDFTAIGIDVIVGFPGESEEDFKETYNFLSSLDFAYAHIFPYSNRKNTASFNFKNQQKGDIIKHRSQLLDKLSREKNLLYKKKLINNKIKLCGVIEKKTTNKWSALSDHSVRIYSDKGDNILKNGFMSIIASRLFSDGVKGALI